MNEDKQQKSTKIVTRKLPVVFVSIVIFYMIIVLFDSKGIYFWVTRLPISTFNQEIRPIAKSHWEAMAEIGLEEPKYSIETEWMELQEVQKIAYPKKYAVWNAKNLEREQKNLSPNSKIGEKAPNKQIKIEKEVLQMSKVKAVDHTPNVLIIGDSLMMTVGPIIKRDIESQLKGVASVKAKIATGLARPDVFDWKNEVESLTGDHNYTLIIIMMGANDSQDFLRNGAVLTYGTSEWVKAYNERVDGLMDVVCKKSPQGMWIGLPPMQARAFNRKSDRLNQWIIRTAEKHPCMKVLPTTSILGSRDGGFIGFLPVNGRQEKVRMTDGIHITTHGAKLISESVIKSLKQVTVASPTASPPASPPASPAISH